MNTANRHTMISKIEEGLQRMKLRISQFASRYSFSVDKTDEESDSTNFMEKRAFENFGRAPFQQPHRCFMATLLLGAILAVTSVQTVSAQSISCAQHINFTNIGNNMPNCTLAVTNPNGNCSGDQETDVRSMRLMMKLDVGDLYTLGGLDWEYDLNFVVTGYMDVAENVIANNFTFNFNINDQSGGAPGHPKNLAYVDFVDQCTTNGSCIDHFKITTFSHTLTGDADYLAADLLRFQMYIEEKIGYNVLTCNGAPTDIVVSNGSLKTSGVGSAGTGNDFTNVQFEWSHPTNAHFDKYDLEVLKLEPHFTSSTNADVPVDWTKAARYEVDGGQTNYDLTITEGTGYYIWRVRPIGTFYEGDRANRLNYGLWNSTSVVDANNLFTSHAFSPGSNDYEASLTGGESSHKLAFGVNNSLTLDYFYFEQFNEDYNWSHTRVLTEGSRQSETMSFANGLNQVQQQQTRLFSKQEVIGTQTVYDYSARPSLQSLPAKVESQHLGYQPDFFDNTSGDPYSAADFDKDVTVYTPMAMSANLGTVEDYYSNNNKDGLKDLYIPTTDNVPYTRTLFTPDATGRVAKQAGPGSKLKLRADGDPDMHNTVTMYSAVDQVELDRIFGNEGPDTNQTLKIITKDPNGVNSVAYRSKAGQVLATCLDFDGVPDNQLDPGGSETFPVTRVLPKSQVIPGSFISESTTSLVITANSIPASAPSGITENVKEVQVNYSITPQQFAVDCDPSCTNCDFCWECDYTVEIGIRYAQDPSDPKRNVTALFQIHPSSTFVCGTASTAIPLSSISTAAVASGGNDLKILGPDGLDNTELELQNIAPTGTIFLQEGTYQVYKRVYLNNKIDPDAGTDRYLESYREHIRDEYAKWTATDNCCGPFGVDTDGFICDPVELTSANINCGNCTTSTCDPEIIALADSLRDLLIRESEATMATSATTLPLYTTLLTTPATLSSVTLGYYTPGSSQAEIDAFRELIEELVCEYGSHYVNGCFGAYGAMLETNIAVGEQVANGNAGNATGSGNPAANFNPDFDLLAGVFACLGYNQPCGPFQNAVLFHASSQTTEETDASTAADNDPDYHYYVVWDLTSAGYDLSNSANHTSLILGTHYGPATATTSQVTFIQIDPDPVGSPTCALYPDYSCWNAFAYLDGQGNVNALAAGMTEPEGRLFLAQEMCGCLAAQSTIDCNTTIAPDLSGMDQFVLDCRDNCEDRRDQFGLSIASYIEQYNANNGILSPEVNGGGLSIWDAFDPLLFKDWQEYDDIFTEDSLCLIDRMVEECYEGCEMSIQRAALADAETCYNCTTTACTVFASTYIPGSTSLPYNCMLDFMQSAEFADAVEDERLAFQQTMQWSVKTAALDNPFSSTEEYSNFGTEEDLNWEMVDFFRNSLNRMLNERSSTTTTTTSTTVYPQDWSGFTPGSYYYQQSTHDFTYPYDNGTAIEGRKGTAVTNVVWNQQGTSTLADDEILEINVAVYCDNSAANPGSEAELWHWAYTPPSAGSSTPCTQLNVSNPAGFKVEHDIVDFYFDEQNAFHAVLKESACDYGDPLATTASGVAETTYLASADVVFNSTITNYANGEHIRIEVGPGYGAGAAAGPNVYIFNDYLQWETSYMATSELVTAVANAINNNFTIPDYMAEANGNTLTIYVPNEFTLDPEDYEVTITGTIPSSNFTLPPSFALEGENLGIELASCNTGTTNAVADANDSECPYAYFKTGTSNTTEAYDMTVTTEKDAFEDDLEAFWLDALEELIQHRTINTTPEYPDAAFVTGTVDDWVYYEKTTEFLVNGAWHKAYVSIVGQEDGYNLGTVSREKTIWRIQIGLNCLDGGSELVKFIIETANDTDPIFEPSSPTPSLTIDPSGTMSNSFNPAITWAQDIFDDIDFYLDNSTDDYVRFTMSSAYGYWTDKFPSEEYKEAWVEYPTSVSTSPTENSTPATATFDNFLSGTAYCSVATACEFCMKWQRPFELAPGNIPVPTETPCADLKAQHIANQVASSLDSCFNAKLDELESSYRNNCLYDLKDRLTLTFDLNYGHYTLYYYDRANRLIQTVPPEGVNTGTDTSLVRQYREQWKAYVNGGSNPTATFQDPAHRMISYYYYNSIGQLMEQITPDGNYDDFATPGNEVDPTRFWYNANGQLILSQDAQQTLDLTYSYTQYDALGRVIETGEVKQVGSALLAYDDLKDALWSDLEFPYQSGVLNSTLFASQKETTRMYYSNAANVALNEPQRHLRNRISWTLRDADGDFYGTTLDQYYTYYSYDPHGNVEWLVRELPEIGKKSIHYTYDLVSGNVLQVVYNQHTAEQLMHRYTYDEDNRIVLAETSTDGIIWDKDAAYDYYAHGPLARTAIGEDALQGCDFVYTTEGWLKSINQVEMQADGTRDPGMDGAWVGTVTFTTPSSSGSVNSINFDSNPMMSGSVNWTVATTPAEVASLVVANINVAYDNDPVLHPWRASNEDGTSNTVTFYAPNVTNPAVSVASSGISTSTEDMKMHGYVKDEFAMELGYYDGDFNRTNSFIGANNTTYDPYGTADYMNVAGNVGWDLYNGNISYWMHNTREAQDAGNIYGTTGLGIRKFRYDYLNRLRQANADAWSGSDFTLLANNVLDEDFTYDANGNINSVDRWGNIPGSKMDEFTYNYPVSGTDVLRNRLKHVADDVGLSSNYTDDIDNQPVGPWDNYFYDAEGKLTRDAAEGILDIDWNIQNKVTKVYKLDGSSIAFDYDETGNRVSKTIYDVNGDFLKSSYYVRDAQGNIMAVYDKSFDTDDQETTLRLKEQPLYGSKRIGTYNPNLLLATESGNYNWNTPFQSPLTPTGVSSAFAKSELNNWVASATWNQVTNTEGLTYMDFTTATPTLTTYNAGHNLFKNGAMAEDEFGQIDAHFVKTYVNGSIPNGYMLEGISYYAIVNGHDLKGAYDTKSIAVRAWDDRDVYFVVTGENGTIYHHKVDMTGSQVDLSYPNGKPEVVEHSFDGLDGSPTTKQQGTKYDQQYALAAYNDMESANANMLYVATHTATGLQLYSYRVSESGFGLGTKVWSCPTARGVDESPVEIIGENPFGNELEPLRKATIPQVDLGEMQISPNGDELAVNYYCGGKHVIRRFAINQVDASLTYINTLEIATESAPASATGNLRNDLDYYAYSFDYDPSGDYIYFMQKYNTGSSPEASKLRRIEIATGTIEDVKNYDNKAHLSEVRRGKDQHLYVNWRPPASIGGPTSYHQTLDVIEGSLSGPVTSLTTSTYSLGAGNTNYGLPLQPHLKESFNFSSANEQRMLGDKTYELTDHLGNVRATFSDKRMAFVNSLTNEDPITDFDLDVTSWTDYYAFGAIQPGRNASTPNYRYGFNGMEKDDELKSTSGSSYDFGARLYDPRLGKWLKTDPLAAEYPYSSPYVFAGNSPLVVKDPDGRWIYVINSDGTITKVNPAIDNVKDIDLQEAILNAFSTEMGNEEWCKYSESQSDHVFLFRQNFEDERIEGWTYGERLSMKGFLDKEGKFTEDGSLVLYLSAVDDDLKEIETFIKFNENHKYYSVGIVNGLKGYNLAETVFHELHIHITNSIKNGKGNDEHRSAGIYVDDIGNDNYWLLKGGPTYKFNQQLIEEYATSELQKEILKTQLDERSIDQDEFDKKTTAQIERENATKEEDN